MGGIGEIGGNWGGGGSIDVGMRVCVCMGGVLLMCGGNECVCVGWG